MKPGTFETLPMTYARTAGFLYLVIAVFGAFSIAYVPFVIVASGDAATTAHNLLAHQGLFRMGIAADVVVILCEVVLTAMLYIIFKPVSPTLSLMAAFARLSMIIVMGVNVLINIMPLVLLHMFPADQVQATILTLFEAHGYGVYVWQLFFGLHLITLGYLVIKSDLAPHFLGWMMAIGSLGYLTEGLAKITFTENGILSIVTIGFLIIVTIGELSFAFWLLIKGLRPPSATPSDGAGLIGPDPKRQ